MVDRRPLLGRNAESVGSEEEERHQQNDHSFDGSPLSSQGSMRRDVMRRDDVMRRASEGDYAAVASRRTSQMRNVDEEDDEYHNADYDSDHSDENGKRLRYHSDGAMSEDDNRATRSKGRLIQDRLPMIPSKARFPGVTSTKRGVSNKLPRKIPRRIKGKFRRIVADAAEERTGRIAVYCPANEIDLDDVYAHMLQVRQRCESTSSSSITPGTLGNNIISDPHTFKIGTNKSTILPPANWNSSRRTVPLSPRTQALNIHTRDTIDSPAWQASIFFDVLHLRQRIEPVGGNSSAATVAPTGTEEAANGSFDGAAKESSESNARRQASTKRQTSSSRILSDFEEDEYSDVEGRHWHDEVVPNSGHREVFLFGFGCVVCWNWESEDHEMRLVRSLAAYCRRMLDEDAAESAADDMEYFFGSQSRVRNDTIELSSGDPVERLAVSFAVAQSSLLSVYEYRLDQIIERNEHIPVTLAREGKINMSQTAISREIGRLFLERNMINLESDILGTPEFFWHHDEFDPVYRRMCDYMEQDDRLEILNKRLDCVRELLDVLSSQVENQHASKLEWIIIWLILCEVVVQVVWGVLIKDILGFFQRCNGSDL